MIYRDDITAEEWCKRYPGLKEALPGECECGATYLNVMPFLIKGCAGLRFSNCTTNPTHLGMVATIPISREAIVKWVNVFY